jgi:hypothetical protein
VWTANGGDSGLEGEVFAPSCARLQLHNSQKAAATETNRIPRRYHWRQNDGYIGSPEERSTPREYP